MALGVAAMGTLIYRGELSGTTVPDTARESLTAAVIFAGLAVTVAIVLGGAERSTEPVADVPELV